jgi:hypothetical protein
MLNLCSASKIVRYVFTSSDSTAFLKTHHKVELVRGCQSYITWDDCAALARSIVLRLRAFCL